MRVRKDLPLQHGDLGLFVTEAYLTNTKEKDWQGFDKVIKSRWAECTSRRRRACVQGRAARKLHVKKPTLEGNSGPNQGETKPPPPPVPTELGYEEEEHK